MNILSNGLLAMLGTLEFFIVLMILAMWLFLGAIAVGVLVWVTLRKPTTPPPQPQTLASPTSESAPPERHL